MHECSALGRGNGSNFSELVALTAVMTPREAGSSQGPALSLTWGPRSGGLEGDRGEHSPRERPLGVGALMKGSQWVWCCGFAVTTVSHD